MMDSSVLERDSGKGIGCLTPRFHRRGGDWGLANTIELRIVMRCALREEHHRHPCRGKVRSQVRPSGASRQWQESGDTRISSGLLQNQPSTTTRKSKVIGGSDGCSVDEKRYPCYKFLMKITKQWLLFKYQRP